MKQNDSVMELCVTQRLSFSCQATGNPKPSMRVYFNGSLVSEGNWYSDSVTHTVPSMSNKDFGTYICQASNSVKKINRTIIVRRRSKSTFNAENCFAFKILCFQVFCVTCKSFIERERRVLSKDQ